MSDARQAGEAAAAGGAGLDRGEGAANRLVHGQGDARLDAALGTAGVDIDIERRTTGRAEGAHLGGGEHPLAGFENRRALGCRVCECV